MAAFDFESLGDNSLRENNLICDYCSRKIANGEGVRCLREGCPELAGVFHLVCIKRHSDAHHFGRRGQEKSYHPGHTERDEGTSWAIASLSYEEARNCVITGSASSPRFISCGAEAMRAGLCPGDEIVLATLNIQEIGTNECVGHLFKDPIMDIARTSDRWTLLVKRQPDINEDPA